MVYDCFILFLYAFAQRSPHIDAFGSETHETLSFVQLSRGAMTWATLAQSVCLSALLATKDSITPLKALRHRMQRMNISIHFSFELAVKGASLSILMGIQIISVGGGGDRGCGEHLSGAWTAQGLLHVWCMALYREHPFFQDM